jgi:hypothetical protein
MSVLNVKNDELPFPRQRVTMTGSYRPSLVIIGSVVGNMSEHPAAGEGDRR